MARKIVITSGKGGVGKTTVAANLGVQLARMGKRVLVCDLDFGLNNIDVVLGVEALALYDVIDVIEGRCRPKQALVQHPQFPSLFSLTSNRISERYVSPQAIRLILEGLAPQFDYILLDSPAGIEDGFHRAVATAEEALLVTTPHISAMRDADRVSSMLRSYQLKRIGLIVNLVRGDMMKRGEILTAQEISEVLRLPLVAVVPEEDEIFLHNVFEKSKAFRLLAKVFDGGKGKMVDPERKYGGFWGAIKSGLKRRL